jgi:hypothetical protein
LEVAADLVEVMVATEALAMVEIIGLMLVPLAGSAEIMVAEAVQAYTRAAALEAQCVWYGVVLAEHSQQLVWVHHNK